MLIYGGVDKHVEKVMLGGQPDQTLGRTSQRGKCVIQSSNTSVEQTRRVHTTRSVISMHEKHREDSLAAAIAPALCRCVGVEGKGRGRKLKFHRSVFTHITITKRQSRAAAR